MSTHSKEIHDIEEYVNPANWRWSRWMVRADGKVFWQYQRGREYWVTWEQAVKTKSKVKEYNATQRVGREAEHAERNRKWREENIERHRANSRRWGKLNRERVAARKEQRRRERVLEDPLFDLRCRLRARCGSAIRNKGYYKGQRTTEILGADWPTIKAHLESMFVDGMSWDNRSEWHIDHIKPLASANTEDELIALCHYTNLQPLWAADNLRKGAK